MTTIVAVSASATAVTAMSIVSISVSSCQFPVPSSFPVPRALVPRLETGNWKLETGDCVLSQLELHRDFNHHVNRSAETPGRRKAPLFHRVDGALIEAAAKTAKQPHVAYRAVRADDDLEFDVARKSTPPRFFGVVGPHFLNDRRRG